MTIAVGVIIYLLLYSGKFYPEFWAMIGIPYNMKLTAIVSAGVALLGIVLYAKAAKRRKHYDKGLMNVLALVVSMLVFTFFLIISIALAISSL